MTKDYFIELANYNIWANDIVCVWLEKISDEQWTQHITSSFNSIKETVLHLTSAEKAWLERLQKKPNIIWLQFEFNGSKQEVIDLWKTASAGFKSFMEAFDESEMHTNLDYKRINGDAYSKPHYQVFAHVFNHSTYHRGQLVTMLRQVGFTDISSTDLLGFYK